MNRQKIGHGSLAIPFRVIQILGEWGWKEIDAGTVSLHHRRLCWLLRVRIVADPAKGTVQFYVPLNQPQFKVEAPIVDGDSGVAINCGLMGLHFFLQSEGGLTLDECLEPWGPGWFTPIRSWPL